MAILVVHFAVGVPVAVAVGVSVSVSVAVPIASAAIRISVTVPIGFQAIRSRGNARFGVLVAALVKIGEETEEEDAVASDPPNKGLGVVAIDEEQLERVHHNGDELNHLKSGEIFLPPNEFLVLWSHGGHHVVEIHDDVDESVEQTEESRVATRCETDSEPDAHRHNAVMHNVQKRDMFILFAQNEENRVEELGELGEIIPPAGVHHPNGQWIIGIIHRLASVTVTICPARHGYLVEEPRAEDDLNRVVNDQSAAKLEGWTVFHVGRSPHFNEHDVSQANEERRQRRAHKQPILHSPVS